MRVLGICSDVWISSAALIEDGRVIAAAPEERFNRQKKYKDFPKNAVDFCLKKSGCALSNIDYIAIAWNPGRHIKRFNPRFSGRSRWRAEHLYAIPNNLMQFFEDKGIEIIEQNLRSKYMEHKIIFVDHHMAHAANAFFLSPFKEAAILSADGRGEEDTILYAIGSGNKIERIDSVRFPHSLGLFYGTFTEFLGFVPDSDEWKVMALSSFADTKNNPYYEKMKKIIKFQNGQVELDLSYFSYYLYDQLYFYSEKLVKEFGEPRKTDSELTERHYQIAGALQAITEEVLEKCLNHLYEIVGSKNVVVSGGVFMNSVFNGKITQRTRFEDMFISSCPDDSGASIGAALYVYNIKAKDAKREVQSHNYYGPEFTNDEIKDILKKYKIVKEYKTNVEEYVAKAIASGKMVGWFQGRMEFGQRALGNRSILCDPRDPKMKDKINSAVKYRESFRPFAPSILEEYKLEYFDMPRNVSVPFMERVYVINNEKQKTIPAVTHIDGTGRLQTVRKEDNPRYYRLIQEFQKITGIPVVLNTSFNLNGEPIVCTPTDAIRTFYSCGLDMLVLGNYVIEKKMKENQTTHE